jgi:hypothetical protein
MLPRACGPCQRSDHRRERASLSGQLGAVAVRWEHRRSRRPCHPRATSSGHERYVAVSYGHCEEAGGLVPRPLTWAGGGGRNCMACKRSRPMRRPGAEGHRPAVTGGTAPPELPHQGKGGHVCHREGDHDVASVPDRSAGGAAASRPACRGQPCAAGRPDPTSSSRRSKARSVHHRGTDLCPPSPRDGHRPGLRSRQLPDLGNASPKSR